MNPEQIYRALSSLPSPLAPKLLWNEDDFCLVVGQALRLPGAVNWALASGALPSKRPLV